MARTLVKVCGITSASDARLAVAAGADAVGVIFAESPRQVSLEDAEEILGVVPPAVARVGVFVDAPHALVTEAASRLALSAVQFSGDESPSVCASCELPVIRKFAVGDGFDWRAVEAFEGAVSAVLLETASMTKRGGTGRVFDWRKVGPAPEWVRLIVAGGLNPVNVGRAIETLRPYGVDVSSGVEERPRHKDPQLVEAFMMAVRSADERRGR